MEVEKLEAGRELDAMVAERVMGWACPAGYNYWMTLHGGGTFDLHALKANWNPSTDIAAAWEVLNHWQGDYLVRRQNGIWRVEMFKPSEQWDAAAETFPLAVCQCALRATSAPEQTQPLPQPVAP